MEIVSFLTSVSGVISQISIIKKVFTDNRGTNKMQGERHIHNIPYVDMLETPDFDEHSDNSKIRESTISGIIMCQKRREVYGDVVDAFIDRFKTEDHMSLSISTPSDFSERLYQIPFSVTGFQSVSK